jgi:putative DNA methylase
LEHDWPGSTGLAEDVRYYGQWMRDEAEKRIGHLYPKVEVTATMAHDRPDLLVYVGQQLTVIAWIWARTVVSPNPAANGAHVPLVRSFWLSTKAAKKVWIEPIIERNRVNYRFEIRSGSAQPRTGTVGKNGDTCLLTGSPITREHIRKEGMARRIKTRLIAIVAEGRSERVFLAPNAEHESVLELCRPPSNLSDTEIVGDSRYLTPTSYGMTKHRHLFTDRQLVALATFADLVSEARARVLSDSDGSHEYADALALFLGLLVSKSADYWSNLCVWRSDPKNLGIGHVFSRQALSMAWDFAECNPFSASSGSWGSSQRWTELVLKEFRATAIGNVSQISANRIACPIRPVISTDPPYYDNVPYADLSDFFYVWLRRCLQPVFPELLRTMLVPKSEELVADPFRQGGKEAARQFFERGMGLVFEKMRETTEASCPATIYYAFKQTEDDDEPAKDYENTDGARSSTGWETFLQGLADTGWQIDGTWPIRTEMGNRTRSMSSNALASSIVLVCRPRPDNASLATRKEFIMALRSELPEALRNLQRGNIAPVDLAQAAIGPGMAVFTRYVKVIESDGSVMTVRTALGLINQSLDEVLAEQEGEFDGDTRWALAWFDQYGTDEGPFGDAETLSKAKNTAVNGLVEAGIITARAGKVRLVKRDELPGDWNPATDKRLTVWEVTQHLIRTLDQDGELRAATLVQQLGGMAEISRDLAYRLYSTCERKKWSQEAMAYNSLVVAWSELTKLALANRNRQTETQQELFS